MLYDKLKELEDFLETNLRKSCKWKFLRYKDNKTYLSIYDNIGNRIYTSDASLKFIEDNSLTVKTLKNSRNLQPYFLTNDKILKFENTRQFYDFILANKNSKKVKILNWIDENCEIIIKFPSSKSNNLQVEAIIKDYQNREIYWHIDIFNKGQLNFINSNNINYYGGEELNIVWKKFNYEYLKNDLETLYPIIKEHLEIKKGEK